VKASIPGMRKSPTNVGQCDELKPCSNCARHGVPCSLVTWDPSAPQPSPGPTPSESSSAPKHLNEESEDPPKPVRLVCCRKMLLLTPRRLSPRHLLRPSKMILSLLKSESRRRSRITPRRKAVHPARNQITSHSCQNSFIDVNKPRRIYGCAIWS
jgi:hypothetical protein